MSEDRGFENPDDNINPHSDPEHSEVESDTIFEPFPVASGGFMIIRKLVKLPEFKD